MKEEEIRPKEIFDKFLELAKGNIATFLSEKDVFNICKGGYIVYDTKKPS